MLVFGLAISACQGEKATSAADGATATATAPVPATIPAAPAAANGAVEHYTCPNGHAGFGAGAAGNCSQCGTTLVHNQAFHAGDAITQPAVNANPMQQFAPAAAAANTTTTTITPPTPGEASPAQNAAGVFHYTCGNGCSGGAAGAGNCGQCGSALAHNQAYHN